MYAVIKLQLFQNECSNSLTFNYNYIQQYYCHERFNVACFCSPSTPIVICTLQDALISKHGVPQLGESRCTPPVPADIFIGFFADLVGITGLKTH